MTNFESYLRNIGKSEKTARNYAGAIRGPISNWALDNQLTKQSLVEFVDVLKFESVAASIRQLDIYAERNRVGKGMYNAALNAFSQFLADDQGVFLEQDLDAIFADETTTETEKKNLVSTRIGQGQFRKDLIDYWKGCAATGYRNSRLLIASHIKPWRLADHQERLDPYNGLLLVPNLDKAFDLGYVGFESSGKICISTELEEPAILGVHSDLVVSLEEKHQPYLTFHRENVFLT